MKKKLCKEEKWSVCISTLIVYKTETLKTRKKIIIQNKVIMDTFLLVFHQDCAATCGNKLLRVQNMAGVFIL